LSVISDDTANIPSQGKDFTMIANGIYFSGTPTYSVVGTSTMTFAITGSRWGATGSITVPSGVTIYSYSSFIRGTNTNNGSITLRGGSTLEGYTAGTGTLTLTGNDCKFQYYDNSDGTLNSTNVKSALDELSLRDVLLFTQTEDKTNTCDGTAQSIIGDGEGTLTIPANTLSVGDNLYLKVAGILTANSGDSITLDIKFNSTTIFTQTVSAPTTLSDTPFESSGDIVIRSIGETGEIQINGDRNIFASIGFGSLTSLAVRGNTNIDTTIDNTLSIYYTAPSGASITTDLLVFKKNSI
jgi:hypothetical protein